MPIGIPPLRPDAHWLVKLTVRWLDRLYLVLFLIVIVMGIARRMLWG